MPNCQLGLDDERDWLCGNKVHGTPRLTSGSLRTMSALFTMNEAVSFMGSIFDGSE